MTKENGGAGAGDGSGGVKKTLGRRKIAMKRIETESALQVSFSKRRQGLVKKANELAVSCDAQVLVVVFSPAGRPYTFGSPSVPVVVDRFLNPSAYDAEAAARRDQEECAELQRKAEGLARRLEEEELWTKELDEAVRAAGVWIDGDVEQWELPLLEATLAALEMFQAVAAERTYEMMHSGQALMHPAGVGSGSSTSYITGSHEVMAIDTTLRLIGGGGTFADYPGSSNVSHAPSPMQNAGHAPAPMQLIAGLAGHALAPMVQPPPLAPYLALPFNNGLGYNYLSMGYGRNQQDDGHASLYGAGGVHGPACNFFC